MSRIAALKLSNYPPPLVFGIVFLSVAIVLAVAIPNPQPFPYFVFRVVVALAAAGIASAVPGLLKIKVQQSVQATGAIAVFVVIYFFIPAELPSDVGPGPDVDVEALRQQAIALGPMVNIPEGEATLGSSNAGTRSYPTVQVSLPSYSLDKYEVTNAQYDLCVQAGVCRSAGEPRDTDGKLPVTWVTAAQASRYCQWIGRRLPSEAELERAVRGASGRPWPWGDTTPTSSQIHIPQARPDGSYVLVGVDDARFSQSGATPASEGGITHLVGNVGEWTNTPADTCSGTPYDCRDPWNGTRAVQALFVRGYASSDMFGPDGAAAVTEGVATSPNISLGDTGFRCAASNE